MLDDILTLCVFNKVPIEILTSTPHFVMLLLNISAVLLSNFYVNFVLPLCNVVFVIVFILFYTLGSTLYRLKLGKLNSLGHHYFIPCFLSPPTSTFRYSHAKF